jgi:hypothetical protein
LLSFGSVTAHGPKVSDSPDPPELSEIDEGWGESEEDAEPVKNARSRTTKPPPSTKPAAKPGSTKPAGVRTPIRGPVASSPEIILHDDLSPEILPDIDPDPIEYDADMLTDSRPTLPVPNPLKYDIVPESERNTEIPPEPRVPRIPFTAAKRTPGRRK